MSEIRITLEDPRSAIPVALLAEALAEITGRYPDMYPDAGTGDFNPDDAVVPRSAFVVAWRGDEAVGCGALRPLEDDPGLAEIKRMFIHPSARGLGISRVMLTELEDLARGYGYYGIVLGTGFRQPEAIGLYESAGYQRIDLFGIYATEPSSQCYGKEL